MGMIGCGSGYRSNSSRGLFDESDEEKLKRLKKEQEDDLPIGIIGMQIHFLRRCEIDELERKLGKSFFDD